jgi:hypothetical protein
MVAIRASPLAPSPQIRASPLASSPQTLFGGAGAKNPAQPRPLNRFFIRCGMFFRPAHPVETQRTEGRAGRWLRPKTPWAIPIGGTVPFSLKIRHRISHTHQIATAPPRRTIPRRCTFLPPHRRSSTPYRLARQLFEVVRRLSGLSRGATHLDLAQEMFGVLPRPWTSSWTPTTRPCSLL